MLIDGKTIREIVTEDIFTDWDNKGVEFAKRRLQKLYLKVYNNLDNMEEKRLVLWNLIVTYRDNPKNMNIVKEYSEQLKKDMDNTPNYKNTNKHWYASMLTAYRDSHEDELTYQEKLEINMFCYNAYKRHLDPDDQHYIDMLVAKFNLNLCLKQYDTVIEVIETVLHINKKEYDSILNQLIDDVKKESTELYEKVKKLIEDYNEAVV